MDSIPASDTGTAPLSALPLLPMYGARIRNRIPDAYREAGTHAFLGQLGLYQPPWLTSEKWAMPSVIIMSIWKSLGFNAVILLAGVQGISSEIYESADIDGANVVQKFFKITMPLLKPTIVFVTIISMINSFQAFDQIYVMTKGGPGTATQVVSYLIYMNAFQYFKQGYASAMAYILFIIVFIASIVQLRFSEKNSI